MAQAFLRALFASKPLYGFQGLPLAASTVKVRCVTLAGPLLAGEGAVATSAPYVFTVGMTVGLNAPIGCFVLADDSIIATLSFGTGSGMDGSSKPKTAYSPKPDSTELGLGTISVSGGLASASAVSENGVASKPTFASMTGQWKLVSVYTNSDENYVHPCDMDYDATEYPELNASCKSAWSSKGIYIHQITASDGSENRYGLALWNSQEDLVACGNKEGVELESGWSEDAGWVAGRFSFSTLDMSNITEEMLTGARFKKSVGSSGVSNCPKGDDNTTELAGCTTATTCADFDFDGEITNGETRSMEKARCIANALVSGSDFGYQWGSSQCGVRANIDWSSTFASSGYKTDGTGCTDSACDIIDFQPSGDEGRPSNRLFFSEMFVEGNVGTATREETQSCHGATLSQTTAITATQTSETAATFVVEDTFVFSGGTEQQKSDCLSNDSYVRDNYGKVTRMKLSLQKL